MHPNRLKTVKDIISMLSGERSSLYEANMNNKHELNIVPIKKIKVQKKDTNLSVRHSIGDTESNDESLRIVSFKIMFDYIYIKKNLFKNNV